MATHVETLNERQLLKGLGLNPVAVWPPRCTWYRQDGSVVGNLPCDPYSRLIYLGRGFRPDVADASSRHKVAVTGSLLDAVINFMDGRDIWEGTSSELLEMLVGDDIPVDATRLSKALTKLASQIAVRGVTLERMPRGKQRGIRLVRR